MSSARILGTRPLARELGVSTGTISRWWLETENAPDNPFEKGRPIKADVERLRQWATTRKASQKNKPGGRSKVKPRSDSKDAPATSSSSARSAQDRLADFLDLAAIEKTAEEARDVDGLVSLNKSARRLEVLLENFKLEKFGDKQVARLYSNYQDVLSKLYIRIAQLEIQTLELKQKRGELITTEQSMSISEILVNSLYVNLDQLVQAIIDKAKEQEIAEHGKSKIDSEKLMDLAQLAVDKFKRECHKSYTAAIPKALAKDGGD